MNYTVHKLIEGFVLKGDIICRDRTLLLWKFIFVKIIDVSLIIFILMLRTQKTLTSSLLEVGNLEELHNNILDKIVEFDRLNM